jgi:hypothetical protein
MLHAEWIEYLKRENKSKNFDQIKNYYMRRNLRRFIQIDRNILEQKQSEFQIVHSDEEFNEKCRQNPQNKTLHYFKSEGKNLLWQKSNGPTSSLREYLVQNYEESIDEEEILLKNNEKILIISAEPGMGKSLILDNLTQKSSAENFFLKINLNTCKNALSDMEQLKNSNDLIAYVLETLLSKKNPQEMESLKRLASEEKLILMFDGLDEVNDYKEQVIHLIDAINNSNYSVKKILITTRNHLRVELEDHFKTFSFSLNNFNQEDQKSFLYKYWRSLKWKHHERATSAKLKQSAQDLITQINSIISANINKLIGIPLQTKMLADIYVGKKEEDLSRIELANVAVLYHHFLETKIRIQYEEKSGVKIEQMPKKVKQLFEQAKTHFYLDHTRMASKLLCTLNTNNFNDEIRDLEEMEAILEYGVIVAFTPNKTPTFLHQSFAEFFLAKSCLQKLIDKNSNGDKELEQILRYHRHFLVRKFLNDLIENYLNPSEKNERQETSENKEDFRHEIENCCRENLVFLLKYLIEEKGAIASLELNLAILKSSHRKWTQRYICIFN